MKLAYLAAIALGIIVGTGAAVATDAQADPCAAILDRAAASNEIADCYPVDAELGIGGFMADTFDEGEFVYQPCQWEDSEGPCVWDATTRGNHEGTSFVRHESGDMTYLPIA